MDENELRRKMQAGELAANNGTVMRTLAIAGCDFKFLKLKGLLLALAGGMDRMALCSSINYLADSGYLQVRCIEDKAPSSVSDAELEDLEVKLTPRGIQLQRCVKKGPAGGYVGGLEDARKKQEPQHHITAAARGPRRRG